MSDLVVDTSAQRAAAARLRAVGRTASDLHARGDRLAMLAPGVGAPDPARSVDEFLGAWSYGMGVIGHQVAELAGMLESAAVAFEGVEALLSGGGPAGPLAPIPAPEAPPLPSPVGARWGDVPWTRIPVQLSAAKSPRGLIPGEAGDVEQLAVAARDFAVIAADGARVLGALTLGGWVGAAAAVFAAELNEAPRRLQAAAEAFAGASAALRRHAVVLSDAQLVAAVAYQMWQEAEEASAMWRGVTVGPNTLAPSSTDPGLEGMARATAMLTRAREEVAASGLALVSILDAAAAGAPKDPGLLARFARAVRGFASGFGEGTAGIVTSAVGIVGLAARMNPARALVDPHGYLGAVEAFGAGVAAAATHPRDTLAAVTDWQTWTTDPARAAGRLAPDLLLAIATAGAGTAARAASKADDLKYAAQLNRGAVRTSSPVGVPHPMFSSGSAISNAEVISQGLGLPRTAATVTEAARAGGVDLRGATVKIIEDPEYLRYLDSQGACACAPFDLPGEMHLGPASFIDEPTLVATLAHEREHLTQYQSGYIPGSGDRAAMEAAARDAEGPALSRLSEGTAQ